MKKLFTKTILLVMLVFSATWGIAQSPNLIWADEFSGSSLDLTKWQPQIGDGCAEGICGWGNGELQYYKAENAVVSNGSLKIVAKRERVQSKAYTSARIRTINLADFTYGRMEARIKLPAGAGLWPAFWMLSTNEPYGGWPQSGEIDIMEAISAQSDHVFGTIHYGNPYPNNQYQGNNFNLYDGSLFSDAFHEFAIEWTTNEIRWYVDDILYSVKTAADVAPYQWPFDNDFHFILNVAVGGTLGGTVDNGIFPATMEVDYVRVYDGPKPTISGNRVVDNQATGEVYKINNLPNGVNVNWTVPAGASVVFGQGTSEATINFGGTSGDVTATFNAGSGNQSLIMDVVVAQAYSKAFSFENFDETGAATFNTTTGTLTEVSNPAPNAVNGSALSGRYVRNAGELYDVLVYSTTAIANASEYSSTLADKRFSIDLYTNAPVGTQVILQLETSVATSTNYPSGRHSRYAATIEENGNWHRVAFDFMDRPDGGASGSISNMVLLFNSNSLTGDTYYFDNLDSYLAGAGSTNQSPTVSITSPSNGASFGEGSQISISANAADSDGSVSQVEFFANGNSLGIDNTSPYSINWAVASGSSTLTAVATDNGGAFTTSSPVGVTGTTVGGGVATAVYVQSVVTGTVSAGQGSKSGSATVTIYNDLGNPFAGAQVNGTFSGTFNETAQGVTNTSGQVTFQTTTSAKGGVTVNFCVDNVSATLPYNPNLNQASCGSGARTALFDEEAKELAKPLAIYPNPVKDQLWIQGTTEGKVRVAVIGISGKTLISMREIDQVLDVSTLPSGIYILRIVDGEQVKELKFIK